MFISGQRLRDELAAAVSSFEKGAVLLHSDILRVGIVDRMKPREAICADYHELLTDVFGGGPLLIPTFNYDYCRCGWYDRRNTPSQVGALTDYCRSRFWQLRTLTPVFNFVVFNGGDFSLEASANPFDGESAFGQLLQRDGLIMFLGAGIEANTFLHYVEEQQQVGYRYLKQFPGEIIDGGARRHFVLNYRVRPLLEGAAEYDWPRLRSDLSRDGLLTEFKVGNGRLVVHKTRELFTYWSEKLRNNELYFLTDTARLLADDLFRTFGRPLTVERVE